MKRPWMVKRRWARVRFNPEAKLRHEQFLQRLHPLMYVVKVGG